MENPPIRRCPMERKFKPFNPDVRVRFVNYESDVQRKILQELFKETERQAKVAMRQIESEANLIQVAQTDEPQEILESVPACQGAADCPLVPILQQCSCLRQTFAQVA